MILIIWNVLIDEVKYKIGIIVEGYNNNFYIKKYIKGCEFFEIVNGNKQRIELERIINLENFLNELREVYFGYDNYYYEVFVIKKIMIYFEDLMDIFNEIVLNLIYLVMFCRIGCGYSFKRGVLFFGKEYYDRFFNMFKDDFILLFIV